MTEILIALGELLSIDVDNPAGDLPAVSVRVGGVELPLESGDDYRVWGTLTRNPQTLDSLCSSFFVRTDDDDRTEPVDAKEVAEVVARLRSAGAVVGIADGAAELELAMRIRLLPLWRANPDELATPDGFPIGTVSALTGEQHDVWSSLDERNRVADVAVGNAVQAGSDDVEGQLPDAWNDCIELVRLGAAYFDQTLS